MKIAAIIPARYQSTRFPGKPLTLINGKTMIERVYRQAGKCGKFSDIIVATDDKRIADAVTAFGGHVVMTSTQHTSGTQRLWEVMEKSNFDAAVNIQGDEPAVPADLIAHLYDELLTRKHPVVTPAYMNMSYDDFLSPHCVKVVMGQNADALYFSRSPIPYTTENDFTGFFHHIGLYGYLKSAIKSFINFPPAPAETLEKLEQLRFLENGIPIHVIKSTYKSLGVDVPADVQRIEKLLREKNE